MIIDYLSFFKEIKKPIEYWFYMKEDYTLKDPDDPTLPPEIIKTDFIPDCKIKAGDDSFSLSEYREHISILSEGAIHEIQKEAFKVNDRNEFLAYIKTQMSNALKGFKKDDIGIYRDFNSENTFYSSDFHSSPLSEDELNSFCRPFSQILYDGLIDFKNKFLALFEKDIKNRPPIRNATIVFKYNGYNDQGNDELRNFHNALRYHIDDISFPNFEKAFCGDDQEIKNPINWKKKDKSEFRYFLEKLFKHSSIESGEKGSIRWKVVSNCFKFNGEDVDSTFRGNSHDPIDTGTIETIIELLSLKPSTSKD